MKKIIYLFLMLVFSVTFTPIRASAQIYCDIIDVAENYDICCGDTVQYTLNQTACDNYNSGGGINAGGDNQGGGPIINSCSEGIDKDNYAECCFGTNETIYAIACANYLSSGGGINTNPTNGATTPPVIASTPQASSVALLSCSKISFNSLLDILIWAKCVIGAAIIPLIFALAFIFFLWGMLMYIRGADDVKKREESKKFIYWGIIGLTVMVGVWGIVKIVNVTFGLGNAVPTLQTKDNCLTTDPKNPCRN